MPEISAGPVLVLNVYATETIVAPAWARKARAGVMGAGGGGGATSTTTQRSTGGGGGGYSEKLGPIVGGENFVFTIGAFGAGGAAGVGATGGTSTLATSSTSWS